MMSGTKFPGFPATQAWDSVTYHKIMDKLLANVKEEFKLKLIEQKLREFGEYEHRRDVMKQWEKKKDREIKEVKRQGKQKKRLEKEMKERKKVNGEKAFREWLRKSMGRCSFRSVWIKDLGF